ncbi:Uncharacterized membrane protein YheB, UPF0754 family [Anaerosporobacter mobilis DSM 15930]|uniref:Uncharacterized membrane protein YheB, UPF0754 family n=1 Tax=Anaerosporobacter mobilis DSM 15930 TaxID=1120996 RepID=A0A1M7GQT5_9FIRM|nr:DUF445 family protein [Anaerosporobacter mobilis]SHM18518.1 Uncharacterized membrane protein YheB, UPF0754 family [Anaerosporobacter mobilis DSM 15930]
MEIINVLAGPIIGGVIGYFTNYIAVKMLFRPLKPIRIGKYTLPFTPGIIPKRKPELAHALGQAVGNALLSKDELTKVLTSDRMRRTITDGIVKGVNDTLIERNIEEIGLSVFGQDSYEDKKDLLIEGVTGKITTGFLSMNVGNIIATEGAAALKQKGGMLAMFINEDLIASLATPIGNKVDSYVRDGGKDKIREYISNEIDTMETKSINSIIGGIDTTKVESIINQLYNSMIEEHVSDIVDTFDIQGIVEEKINNMAVRELEDLIMSVMKNELGMIVNLGAIIGFVLGLFNLFF